MLLAIRASKRGSRTPTGRVRFVPLTRRFIVVSADATRKSHGDRLIAADHHGLFSFTTCAMTPACACAWHDWRKMEHRYVYETTRNVSLPTNVIVHHINGIKSDNRPENLIASTRRQHAKIHIRAAQVISLFLDDRLLQAAKAHVQQYGDLPDLESLTHAVHGYAAAD